MKFFSKKETSQESTSSADSSISRTDRMMGLFVSASKPTSAINKMKKLFSQIKGEGDNDATQNKDQKNITDTGKPQTGTTGSATAAVVRGTGVDEESSGLLGAIKSNITNGITKSVNSVKGLTNKVQEAQVAAENWKNFAILFGFGLFFLFASFAFLPVFVVLPAKFAGLFTLGSICMLASVAVLKGSKEFLKSIMQKQKIVYSAAYIFTIIGTLYFSIISKSYLLALVFCIAQMLSLGFFVSTNFPGGTNGMKYITKKLYSIVKSVCCACFKRITR